MKAQRNVVVERGTEVRALQRVGIGIVDAGAVGVELVAEEVVIEVAAGSGERCVAIRGGEVSAIGAEAEFRRRSAAGAGEDLHYAGHGVGTVERALGAAEKLHAIGFGRGEAYRSRKFHRAR